MLWLAGFFIAVGSGKIIGLILFAIGSISFLGCFLLHLRESLLMVDKVPLRAFDTEIQE